MNSPGPITWILLAAGPSALAGKCFKFPVIKKSQEAATATSINGASSGSGSLRAKGGAVIFWPAASSKFIAASISAACKANRGRGSTERYSARIRSSKTGIRSPKATRSRTRAGDPDGFKRPATRTFVSITAFTAGVGYAAPLLSQRRSRPWSCGRGPFPGNVDVLPIAPFAPGRAGKR